jgi:hypothetical protein
MGYRHRFIHNHREVGGEFEHTGDGAGDGGEDAAAYCNNYMERERRHGFSGKLHIDTPQCFWYTAHADPPAGAYFRRLV